MADLVALDIPLGPTMVTEIRRAHDRGRAVCVVDQRWSPNRRRVLLDILSPTHVIDHTATESVRAIGRSVETGDGVVMLTSGSSGPPKAAILTWAAVIASAELTARALSRGQPTSWNACLPPAHVGGFAVLARSIFTDDQLVWGDPHQLESGPALGATHVAVVRTQLNRFDLRQYHVVLLGGSRPPASLDSNVVTTWGMTETGSGVVYNHRPLPGVDLDVVNGEILVHSPTLFRAYRDAFDPTVTGRDGRTGWFPTGDAGEFRDGELHVFGRSGYVINSGGEKVWPDDLEAIFHPLADVDDVVVAGVDDDEWGQRVVAYVVSTRPEQELLSTLAAVANEQIGPWAKPKTVHVVSQVPRTDNGKIRRDVVASWSEAPPYVQSTNEKE